MNLNYYCFRKPKTHKGKRVLERRAPKLVENDKCTLVIKGGHTSDVVNTFLNDLVSRMYLSFYY